MSVSLVAPSGAVEREPVSVSDVTQSDLHSVSTRLGASLVSEVKEGVEKDGGIKVHTGKENLNWDRASAIGIDDIYVVTVPLDNEGTQWSNLTVTFDSEGKISGYTEGHFTELSETSGKVTVYNDGQLITDKVSVAQPDPIQVTTFSIGDAVRELNSCLSAAGIPAWIVAGASAACTAVGGWAGILACYAAAGVAGGTVGYCAGKAAKAL